LTFERNLYHSHKALLQYRENAFDFEEYKPVAKWTQVVEEGKGQDNKDEAGKLTFKDLIKLLEDHMGALFT